mgnify:CR=1 FL=1
MILTNGLLKLFGRAVVLGALLLVFGRCGSSDDGTPANISAVFMETETTTLDAKGYATDPRLVLAGQTLVGGVAAAVFLVSAAFLIGYGAFRFIAEFGREPDDFLGLLTFGMSMGQWLSLPMILIGAHLLWWTSRKAD